MADTISRIAKHLPQIEPAQRKSCADLPNQAARGSPSFPEGLPACASGAQPTKSLILNRDFATGIVWWHHLPWAFKSGIMLSIEQVRMAHRKACTRA
jgi:hypothetical protein